MIYNNSRNNIGYSDHSYTDLLSIQLTRAVLEEVSRITFTITAQPLILQDTEENEIVTTVSDIIDTLYCKCYSTDSAYPIRTDSFSQVVVGTDAPEHYTWSGSVGNALLENISQQPYSTFNIRIRWTTSLNPSVADDAAALAIIDQMIQQGLITFSCVLEGDVRKQITLIEVGTPLKWQGEYIAPLTTTQQVIVQPATGSGQPLLLNSFFTDEGKIRITEETAVIVDASVDSAARATRAESVGTYDSTQGTWSNTTTAQDINQAVQNFMNKTVVNQSGTTTTTIEHIVLLSAANLPESKDANTLYLVY